MLSPVEPTAQVHTPELRPTAQPVPSSPESSAATHPNAVPPPPRPAKPGRSVSMDKWVIGGGVAFLAAAIWFGGSKRDEAPAAAAANVYAPPALPTYAAPTPPAPPPVPIAPTESRPPVGTGMVLSDDQIRYCLSETIRIDTWQIAVDQYSTTSVDSFNVAVADYNSRCSNFKYRRGAVERVRIEVEGRRALLQREGRTLSLRNP